MKIPTYRAPIVVAAASAVALIVGASAAWSASTITVHRGAQTTVVRPGGAELDVGRGEPLAIQPPKADLSADAPDWVTSGRRLWMVDAENRRLRVCVLDRTTQVGERVIRCRERDLPN